MREVAGNEYFYEAACCQAPFSFKTWVTPLVVNRAGGFLKREACICLERTSIHPWSQTIREELGGFEGETILTVCNRFCSVQSIHYFDHKSSRILILNANK